MFDASPRPITRDDPELARLRVLLAALRPDCADPMEPPTTEPLPCHVPAPRDSMAGWGDLPRGYGRSQGTGESLEGDRSVSGILEAVDALPAPAGPVLRWLRGNARASDGVRGVAVSLALAMGVDLPDGLGARRDAASVAGRRLLWGAAAAWGK